jgi:hypothetical protein
MILDRAHFRVTTNEGQEITLSPKTFVALCYLAERAGKLVTREEFDRELKTRGRVDQVIHNLEKTFPGRLAFDGLGIRLLVDPAQIRIVGTFIGDPDEEDG